MAGAQLDGVRILTTHYSLLTTHYSLLTTHYSLLTTHYSLLTTHYSLLITHYSLLTTHHSPLTPHASPQLDGVRILKADEVTVDGCVVTNCGGKCVHLSGKRSRLVSSE